MLTVTYFDRMDRNSKKHIEYTSNLGSPIKKTYEYKVVDGIDMLVPTGIENTQDIIDSYADVADINKILTRYMNGETDLLSVSEGSYGDIRNAPSSYAELFDRIKECESTFDALPIEVKEKFDNSYKKFWSSYGSDYFNGVIDDYNRSLAPVPIDDNVKRDSVIEPIEKEEK